MVALYVISTSSSTPEAKLWPPNPTQRFQIFGLSFLDHVSNVLALAVAKTEVENAALTAELSRSMLSEDVDSVFVMQTCVFFLRCGVHRPWNDIPR